MNKHSIIVDKWKIKLLIDSIDSLCTGRRLLEDNCFDGCPLKAFNLCAYHNPDRLLDFLQHKS